MECQATGGLPIYGIFLITVGGIIAFTTLVLEFVLLPKRRKLNKELKTELLTHAIVTGGSSGIGLAVAQELINQNCKHVTLIARNEKKLGEALEKLQQHAKSVESSTSIAIHSVDVSDTEKITKVASDICTSGKCPTPTMIFNVAGTSSSAAFVDTDYKEFDRLMNINYLGTAYTTRAFLPYMMPKTTTKENLPRAIMFTSSQAGQLGIYGYTAYSASKYALRGLAEALQMELGRVNISVQVAYPPDTDTPGFEEEQIGKPEETKLISETSGLFSPESVAKKMVSSALQKRPPFNIYFGLEGWMLSSLTAGMSPAQNIVDSLCQIFLKGLLRFVSLFYLMDFRNTLHKAGQKNADKGDDNKSYGSL